MKTALLTMLSSGLFTLLIGMEREKFRLEHKGQTFSWRRGSLESSITENEINALAQEYFKKLETDEFFSSHILVYYMTKPEKEAWNASTSDQNKNCKGLEAWVRYNVSIKNSQQFGKNEEEIKNNYQNYISNDNNVKGLGYPIFEIDEPIVLASDNISSQKIEHLVAQEGPDKPVARKAIQLQPAGQPIPDLQKDNVREGSQRLQLLQLHVAGTSDKELEEHAKKFDSLESNQETKKNEDILNLTNKQNLIDEQKECKNRTGMLIDCNPDKNTTTAALEVKDHKSKKSVSVSLTVPDSLKKWTTDNVTLRNVAFTAGGLAFLGATYLVYKKITKKDLENGVKAVS
jgi:hypothetical protein